MVVKQIFKSIYFPDLKEINPKSKSFILAFGPKDRSLYRKVASLTSQEIRELLGVNSFVKLTKKSRGEGFSLNTYCLWKLRKSLKKDKGRVIKKIDPIYTTFRGGNNNPLHRWYSLTQGYSPEYVEYILDNFIPKAKTVYDPFAGTGVTSLVASSRGLTSLYSEINPLFQFLVETKINISNVSNEGRLRIIDNLKDIKENLGDLIKKYSADAFLLSTYPKTFSESKFFDKKTFALVLKVRTLIDELSYSHQLTSDIVLVSTLNSLIPASLLQRAGDVRFKREKELKRKANLIKEIQKNLSNIIDDIKQLESLPTTPVLITEDAKKIGLLPKLKINAVITSPPYLNGTSYFRNTKVELWFLRSIKEKQDLTNFRKEGITAGINNVFLTRPVKFLTEETKKVVENLKKRAYDKRIPRMIVDYFQDMASVFEGLKKHLTKDGVIAIDIGDSIYSGIKVPTDKLLINVLGKLGYQFKKNVVLRKRISRNGEILKQVLLIFTFPKKKNGKRVTKVSLKSFKKWKVFKSKLPHQLKPYSKRNWGHTLHSACSYAGKMKPSLAHFLVKTFLKKGDKLLDPFAGVGTIPFEGALNGIHSYGFEISPVALFIAKAKLGRSKENECFELINRLEKYIKSTRVRERELNTAKDFGFNKKLIDYYEPKTLKEIVKARQFFKENPPSTSSECLVIASLLHVLHGNRPYALSRRSHSLTPFAPTGSFKYKPLIKHLTEKVNRSLSTELPEDFIKGEMVYQDATSWWPRNINNLDAIITSPPFYDSTRFYLANWIRLWFSGWDPEDFEKQPLGFVEKKQKNSFKIYESVLRQAKERLSHKGIVVFHLGKSRKCNMAIELAKLAKRWFKHSDTFNESVAHCESHGIRDKGTVTDHQYLILY